MSWKRATRRLELAILTAVSEGQAFVPRSVLDVLFETGTPESRLTLQTVHAAVAQAWRNVYSELDGEDDTELESDLYVSVWLQHGVYLQYRDDDKWQKVSVDAIAA